MKEVTRNEAMAGTWTELSQQERRQLLEDLELKSDRLAGDTSIELACMQDDWSQLPIPLQTFLDSHFDEGCFSKTALRKKCEFIAANLDDFHKTEQEIG